MGFERHEGASRKRYAVELVTAAAFLVLAFYAALTLFASWLIQSDNQFLLGLGALTYVFNAYMCHQLPERALVLFGQHMSLCSRVLTLVLGSLLAFPASLHHRHLPEMLASPWFVLLTITLLGIDGTTQLFGLRESDLLLRATTGLSTSFAIVYYLLVRIEERYPGANWLRKGAIGPAIVPFALFAISVLLAGAFFGTLYKSESHFIERTREARNASQYLAFYIAPHAFKQTIRSDGYLSTYDDPVLWDVARMNTMGHEFGAWVVLALDGPPEFEGKHAFLSGGRGTYYYYDAMSGELIATREHAN